MPEFTEKDQERVLEFIKAHPFVTLIGTSGTTPVATQIPVLIEETNGALRLRGHFMRNTDHHLAFEQNPEVLILFTGPQCYVSAGWYNERGHGSTWNYMTVHVRGRMIFFDNEQTIGLLKELTHRFEDRQAHPELVENMTDHYIRSNVKAIAGFEVEVHSVYPLFKLSQNRNDESYRNIVSRLNEEGDANSSAIASEMIRRRPQLF